MHDITKFLALAFMFRLVLRVLNLHVIHLIITPFATIYTWIVCGARKGM